MDHDERFTKSIPRLKAFAKDAPLEAGVYIMRDEKNRIMYVGKARVLRNRLLSYFSGTKDIKTRELLKHVHSLETIIVANEYEALLLENTLIKQHFPKYNINLKDGKTYPVIRITAEEYPRIFRTRHIIEDGSLYFGPFPNIPAVDTMLELAVKLFPLRRCRTLRKRRAPCMYYHIGRCGAPCCGMISGPDYSLHVERVKQLLSGETEALTGELTRAMEEAARSLRFERAGQLRDAIKSIRELSGGSAVVDSDPEGRDYIAWASEGVFTTYTVFSMRGGKMTGRELFSTQSAASELESLETFIASYYDPARPPPPKIYLTTRSPAPPASNPAGHEAPGESGQPFPGVSLAGWFRAAFGNEPEFIEPTEKHHAAIFAMARQNAREDIRKRLKERGAGPALDELFRVLGLRARPERIEGFDIAQLDGKHPVASLVSFKNGIPDRKNYRHFKLKSVIGIVDDFAAMREAVRRRYSRLLKEASAELPDLILIDGGIGQVNAAKEVLEELGMNQDLVGLAKRDEELWLPRAKEPVVLSKRSEALKVLQFVRDETHRFATSLNQKLRSKDLAFKVLESIDGIGKRRAAAIMKACQTLARVAAAPPAELARLAGISEKTARAALRAAKMSLEDQAEARKNLAAGVRGRAYPPVSGTGADIAAEAPPTFDDAQ